MTPQAVIQTVAQFAFAVIVFLLPLIIKIVFPEIVPWLKAHLTAAQWAIVVALAQAVVQQAEQLKKAGVLPSNEAALKWASQQLHALLFLRGIDLPMDNLVTAIESAVNECLPHAAKPAAKA
jgi:Bacteriophage holin of superfamily 6 (Holin_LLH)